MAESAFAPRVVGRYELYEPIASGGMGTVYIGRMSGPRGFSRVVAIKRLHPHLAREERFTSMLLDEARLATRISHPHVVPILDVVEADGELLLVLEYVHGSSLSRLVRRAREQGAPCPPRVAASLMAGVCHGLHAAHRAKDEGGRPMGLVHRDVSPQNILVGGDGLARITDFGIAKATGRAQETETGQIKGKFRYMAPEQLQGEPLDCRVDVFSTGIVLWELLVGEPLFDPDAEPAAIVTEILFGEIRPPSDRRADVPPALDALVMRALARDPDERFASAEEMATALTAVFGPVPMAEVVEWTSATGADAMRESSRVLARAESGVVPAASREPKPVAEPEPRSTPSEPATVTGKVTGARSIPARPGWRTRTAQGVAALALALVLAMAFRPVGLRTRKSPGDPPHTEVKPSVPEPPDESSPSASPAPTPPALSPSSSPESTSAKRDSVRPPRASPPAPRVRAAPAARSASPASSATAPAAAARVLEGIPNDRTWRPSPSATPP